MNSATHWKPKTFVYSIGSVSAIYEDFHNRKCYRLMKQMTKHGDVASAVLNWHDERETLYHLEIKETRHMMIGGGDNPNPPGFYEHELLLHLYEENDVFEHRLRFNTVPMSSACIV